MKTRDRRTLKDDILFSDDMADMFRTMESDSVKKFVISIWNMGKRANEAGYKKDTPEEIEQAISEALDDEYSKATADETNPFYLMYFKAIRGKIESQTVKYYQNSLKNSANAQKADENEEIFNGCTAEQKSEFYRCLDWTVNHSAIKNPTTRQKKVIMEFVKQGGTEAYISSRYLREPEQLKHNFDPITVMKARYRMSHQIGYLEFSKRTSPKSILKKINGFAYDPQESSGYHGNLTFHPSPIYKNYDDALAAIRRYDNGWYSDHAVVYRDKDRHLKWLVKYEYHC